MKKTKKIIINREKKLYVKCHLFDKKEEMQKYYQNVDKKRGKDEGYYDKVLGVHLAYERYHKPKRKWILHHTSPLIA